MSVLLIGIIPLSEGAAWTEKYGFTKAVSGVTATVPDAQVDFCQTSDDHGDHCSCPKHDCISCLLLRVGIQVTMTVRQNATVLVQGTGDPRPCRRTAPPTPPPKRS